MTNYKMKRFIFLTLMIAATLTACGTKEKMESVTISGRFVGANVDSVYLERITDEMMMPERVAAVALADNGAFSFEMEMAAESSPRFYRLAFPADRRPVTLVVAPGDNITLESAGDVFLNYEVTGSEESALIREFNRDYFGACDRLALIAERIGGGDSSYDEREAYGAAQEAMQAQMRFVGSHQSNLASFYAMRHNIAEQYIPQLDGMGINIVHYRAVLEGIRGAYPDSPYATIIERDIEEAEAIADLVSRVEEASFPDIELQDMYKVSHKLSDLAGKVIMLYFWTSENAYCNNINAELKELYSKYHDKGFEVYHVAADTNEAAWIEAVRQQGHPWISLFAGNHPEVFTLYNIAQLPMAYLIDREGNMSIGAFDMETLEDKIRRLL